MLYVVDILPHQMNFTIFHFTQHTHVELHVKHIVYTMRVNFFLLASFSVLLRYRAHITHIITNIWHSKIENKEETYIM